MVTTDYYESFTKTVHRVGCANNVESTLPRPTASRWKTEHLPSCSKWGWCQTLFLVLRVASKPKTKSDAPYYNVLPWYEPGPFFIQGRSVDTHLWVIISDTEKGPDKVVMVSITTWNRK